AHIAPLPAPSIPHRLCRGARQRATLRRWPLPTQRGSGRRVEHRCARGTIPDVFPSTVGTAAPSRADLPATRVAGGQALSRSLGGELVSDAVGGQEVAGGPRVGFDLAPDVLDVCVDVPLVRFAAPSL